METTKKLIVMRKLLLSAAFPLLMVLTMAAANRNYMWFDCEANYRTGLYYSYITNEDIDRAAGTVPEGQSTEAGLHLELKYCYSVEGGAELAKQITKGVVPVTGSIYVEQYIGSMEKFAPAVEQAIRSTGGVMVFDVVHLGKHGLWDDLERAMRNSKQIK